MQYIIGLCAFWMGETFSVQHLKIMLETVFSGQIAPLIFFPKILQTIANFLPFKYFLYFPTQIFLGRISGPEILSNFLILFAWEVCLWIIVILMWHRGLRRFEGVGI